MTEDKDQLLSRTLTLGRSTATGTLVRSLFSEVELLRECPVDNQEDVKRLMHNISRISTYINKRWSH